MTDKRIIQKVLPQVRQIEMMAVCQDGVTNQVMAKEPNIRTLRLTMEDGSQKSVVLKKKSASIILKGSRMLSGGSLPMLADILLHHKVFGYCDSYLRESCFYDHFDSRFSRHMLHCYGSVVRAWKQESWLCLEKFSGAALDGMQDFRQLLGLMADIHAYYFCNSSKLKKLRVNRYSVKDYRSNKKTLRRLFDRLDPGGLGAYTDTIACFIDRMDEAFAGHQKIMTLTHNDLSERNIVKCDEIQIYDWELACVQNPEHDLAEFLVSAADRLKDHELLELIGYFRNRLYGSIGVEVEDEEFRDILRYNLMEYAANKLTLLRTAERYMHIGFTDGYCRNLQRLLHLTETAAFNTKG